MSLSAGESKEQKALPQIAFSSSGPNAVLEVGEPANTAKFVFFSQKQGLAYGDAQFER
jgi:hypothetical protein